MYTVFWSPLTMPNHSPPSLRNFTPSYAPLQNTAWVLDHWGLQHSCWWSVWPSSHCFSVSVLRDTNLTQHVNFPIHDPGSHTLDLVITSTDSSWNPAVTPANVQPSDHFPVFSYLNLSPNLTVTSTVLHLPSGQFDWSYFRPWWSQAMKPNRQPAAASQPTFGWIRHYPSQSSR